MSYGEQRLGQGRENVRNYLRENPSLAAEIDARVREKAAAGTAPVRAALPTGRAQGAFSGAGRAQGAFSGERSPSGGAEEL